jgi:hypothetical protein
MRRALLLLMFPKRFITLKLSRISGRRITPPSITRLLLSNLPLHTPRPTLQRLTLHRFTHQGSTPLQALICAMHP